MKKCPVDGRQFKTAAALQQHRRDSHSGAAAAEVRKKRKNPPQQQSGSVPRRRSAIAPVAVAGYRGPPQTDALTVSGSDILSVVTVPKDISSGRLLADLVVNPRLFQGTRMTQLAGLYNRWRPIKLEVIVQASVPTTVGGQIAMGWASDPREDWPNAASALVRKVNTLRPSTMFHLWELGVMRLPTETSQKWLYCAEEGPDSEHGRLAVLLTAAPTSSTGPFGVTIRLNWTIQYQSPDMPSVGITDRFVRAEEGYYPYFTTGSRFLGADKVLTVECVAAGGANSIVRFRGIEAGSVYTPVETNQLKYKHKAAGATEVTEKSVGAIVKAKSVVEPYVYCFATKEDAQAYVASGDVTKIIPYEAPGPWCTGNPLWNMVPKVAVPLLTNVGGQLRVNDFPDDDRIHLHVRDDMANATSLHALTTLEDMVQLLSEGLRIRDTVQVRNNSLAPLYVFDEKPGVAGAPSDDSFDVLSGGGQE